MSGKDAVATCSSSTAEIRGRGDMTQGQSMHTESLEAPHYQFDFKPSRCQLILMAEELIDR